MFKKDFQNFMYNRIADANYSDNYKSVFGELKQSLKEKFDNQEYIEIENKIAECEAELTETGYKKGLKDGIKLMVLDENKEILQTV